MVHGKKKSCPTRLQGKDRRKSLRASERASLRGLEKGDWGEALAYEVWGGRVRLQQLTTACEKKGQKQKKEGVPEAPPTSASNGGRRVQNPKRVRKKLRKARPG